MSACMKVKVKTIKTIYKYPEPVLGDSTAAFQMLPELKIAPNGMAPSKKEKLAFDCENIYIYTYFTYFKAFCRQENAGALVVTQYS